MRYNIYQMYHANNCKFGFFVIRNTWGRVIAQITKIEGTIEGERIKGKYPYYGNPKVYCKIYKLDDNDIPNAIELCNETTFIEEKELTCPGNYSYHLI